MPSNNWRYIEDYSSTTLHQWRKFHRPAVIGGIQKILVLRLCISGANFIAEHSSWLAGTDDEDEAYAERLDDTLRFHVIVIDGNV